MGCLFELFFEIFGEAIANCYIKAMQLAVTNKTITEKTKKTIVNTVTTVAAILGVVLIIGLVMLVQGDPFFKAIGGYMTYIPLTIIVLQITVGIVVKLSSHFKK